MKKNDTHLHVKPKKKFPCPDKREKTLKNVNG